MRTSPSPMSALFFAFLITLTCSASAAPIHFNLILNVTDVDEGPACAQPQHFGCGNAPGDIFVGSFDVDSSLLFMPGLKSGDVTNFFLQIGNVVWDQNNPSPLSDFAGFINAAGQFFQTSFDIDVLGGTIVGLRGGVHASADLPSIDFNVIPGGFQAAEFPGDTGLMGALQVVPVPEPPVLMLFFVSIAPLIWVQLRRRVRA